MSQYEDGGYLSKNPTWDVEDSPWKAENVIRIMQRNQLSPLYVAEIGCGAGEILRQLSKKMPEHCMFEGWEISPQAIKLCFQRRCERVDFHLGDMMKTDKVGPYDVILALDVFEHVEDYLGFLRNLRGKAEYKIFHIPLDMSVQSVARMSPILEARAKVGHLHYFCRETALASLVDTEYVVLDWFYTSGPGNRSPRLMLGSNITAERIKRFIYERNRDAWVNLFGGSMMVLAK